MKGDAAGHAGWLTETGVVATSVCQNCGSRRFRADRSMAGRLVCQSCGLAAGLGRTAPQLAHLDDLANNAGAGLWV
jgi:hypothetical protein